MLCRFSAPSGFVRVRPEVVIERHLAADDRVLFPLRRPLGERELRLDDLLEQRVVADYFFAIFVVDLELRLSIESGVL